MKLKPKKVGRKIDQEKPKFDADFLAQVEKLAQGYPHDEFIAAAFGRTLSTWYKWKEQCPEIQVAVARGRSKQVLSVAQTCFDMAVSGEFPDMTRYYLDRFGKAQEIAGQVSASAEEKQHDDSDYQAIVKSIAEVIEKCRDVTPIEPKKLEAKKD